MKRRTIQRALVLSAVMELNDHPTAEEVYRYAAQRTPTISRGTVYRNLSQLAEEGTISRIPVPNAPDRFDSATGPHYHLVCQECGRFVDAPVPYQTAMDRQVAQDTGWECDFHHIIFQGRCTRCIHHTPNHQPNEQEDTIMSKYKCTICGYVYDEAEGYEAGGIAPGTKWEDLPEDFVCPLCSVGKELFEKED